MEYQKSVFYIIGSQFCEKFSYYGMLTCLFLYFMDILLFSDETATVVYHTLVMISNIFPLLGAIVADSWLGKYQTILYFSMLYVFGHLLLLGSSFLTLSWSIREFSIFSLILITSCSGGLRACISAFGADQFKLPEQENYLSQFFAFNYLLKHVGSLLSTLMTPVLRKDVMCFSRNTCYPLVFLMSTISIMFALGIFFAGNKKYKKERPEGNVVLKVMKCISYALLRKLHSKDKREHWLDFANDKYDIRTIEDVKAALNVLKLFLPLPIFWTLNDQQGSRWTYQAMHMNGEVFEYLIKPDQFQFLSSLIIIVFIPVFQYCIYPFAKKFLFVDTYLKKITIGGCLAGIAFLVSAFLELKLEPAYMVKPSTGLAQIRIFNTINCSARITIDDHQYTLNGLEMYQNLSIPANGTTELTFRAIYIDCEFNYPILGSLEAEEGKSMSWILCESGISSAFPDSIEKSISGDPKVRVLYYVEAASTSNTALELHNNWNHYYFNLTESVGFSKWINVNHNSYKLSVNKQIFQKNVSFRNGGVYVIIVYLSQKIVTLKNLIVAEPNSIHMLWLLPQYTILGFGQIMFSIVGMEFAVSQAPRSMKSVILASWFLTLSAGNFLVIVITKVHLFERRVFDSILFAILIFADMVIFAIMAKFYKYSEIPHNFDSIDDNKINLSVKPKINTDEKLKNLQI